MSEHIGNSYEVRVPIEFNPDGSVTFHKELANQLLNNQAILDWIREQLDAETMMAMAGPADVLPADLPGDLYIRRRSVYE